MPRPEAELLDIIKSLKASVRELKNWGIKDFINSPRSPVSASAGPAPAAEPSPPVAADTRELFPGLAPKTFSRPAGPAFQSLEEIQEFLKDCSRCRLSEKRNRLVFGVGNPRAEILFVGEGPGHDEDLKGEPFVGKAGQLLDKILAAINLTRRDVYIANIVKCRPPENRVPLPDEVETCRPFLAAQIFCINPRLTVSLGAPATNALLGNKQPITQIRGKFQTYRLPRPGQPDWKGIILPTYHPAFLLRSPGRKRESWEDFKALREELDHPGSKTGPLNV